MKTKWIAITLLAGLLMGCRTVGPAYVKPPIKSPDAFRGSRRYTRPRATSASLADLKWFEVFKDEAVAEVDQRGARIEFRSARRRDTCGRRARQSRSHKADEFPNIGAAATSRRLVPPPAELSRCLKDSSNGRTFGSLALNLLPSKPIFGAACEAPHKPRGPTCLPPKKTVRPLSRLW